MVAAKRKSLVAECQGEGGGLSGDYWARLRAQFEEEGEDGEDGDSQSEPGTPKAAEAEEEGEVSK